MYMDKEYQNNELIVHSLMYGFFVKWGLFLQVSQLSGNATAVWNSNKVRGQQQYF